MPHDRLDLFLGLLETILALVSTRVLYDGLHYLLHARKGQNLGNEEVISLVLLGGFAAYGIPNIKIADMSLLLAAIYFLVLVMGYSYGTGTGAIAGAMGGCIMVACGWENNVIGMVALMGICAGMLRSQGKLVLCGTYFLVSVMLCFLIQEDTIPFEEMESVALAGGIFLVIPERWIGKIQIHAGGWEDNWESERLQHLMQYKLKDFAKSFQNLSESLSKEAKLAAPINNGEMRNMIDVMAKEVCGRCENSENCRGQIALRRPEMFGTLALAQEQGQIVLEQMPVDFMRECIHQERFLSEANQNIHLTNVLLGFQNRMLQNRQVIADQMKEVGDIVSDLSDKLPSVQKVSHDLQEEMERELRKKRVLLTDIAFYEKYDGRLEIHLRGRTWRGRYVTTREVGAVIASVLNKKLVPREECRKVFPREEEDFVFEECAKLRASTGVSRVPKAGEEISGDTFSCMYLPSGELLVALSDGMGSGKDACEESEQVIDLLEQMTEAGFSETSALRLINSIYMTREENGGFTTADIMVLNLYRQNCHFVKCGASTTFLFHQEEVEKIEGEALPIGVMNNIEPYMRKTEISSGDYVIMMTDGVADSFLSEEFELEELIWGYLERKISPQDMSDRILEEAVSRWKGEPDDDMSVLVVRLYENG